MFSKDGCTTRQLIHYSAKTLIQRMCFTTTGSLELYVDVTSCGIKHMSHDMFNDRHVTGLDGARALFALF